MHTIPTRVSLAASLVSSCRRWERRLTNLLVRAEYAYPADELLPLSCKGQGHDRQNPDNAAVNDVMGDYVLTVVDSLDTFPVRAPRSSGPCPRGSDLV